MPLYNPPAVPFTATRAGIVAASGGGTVNFLRADDTWDAPPGTGGPTGANPSATAGPAAVNGSALTFMRSDGAPAIQLGTSSQAGLLQGDGSTLSITAGVISIPATGNTPVGAITLPNGKIAKGNGSNQAAAVFDAAAILGIIDGGGSPIAGGKLIYVSAEFAGTITSVTLLADQSGSLTCNIWKCTYAQFDAGSTHPVSGDSITASDTPALSSATKYTDSTLTGWTTTFAATDVFAFEIPSTATNITRLTVILGVNKT